MLVTTWGLAFVGGVDVVVVVVVPVGDLLGDAATPKGPLEGVAGAVVGRGILSDGGFAPLQRHDRPDLALAAHLHLLEVHVRSRRGRDTPAEGHDLRRPRVDVHRLVPSDNRVPLLANGLRYGVYT